jgi:hypothetical protein
MSYPNSFQYNITSKLSSYQVPIPAGSIMHSKNLFTASIANHSSRALLTGTTGGTVASGLLNIPGIAGFIYTLVGIEITVKSTLTTAVPTGGLFECFNDAIDWVPLQLLTNTSSLLGAAGGLSQSACFIPVQKPLPAGSNIYCYYTSQNAATDWACVSFMYSVNLWQPGFYQTFIAYAYGTSRSSVATFAADGSVAIPANKGGNLVGFLFQVYGTIVTILSVGGTIVVHNAAANKAYEPSEFSVGSYTCIASGGGELLLQKVDFAGDCPGNSTFTFDFTTISTNAQQMGYEVVWEA